MSSNPTPAAGVVQRQQGISDRSTHPQTKHSIKSPSTGGHVTMFQRKPVNHGRQDLAFTSRGFIPDYMSESGAVMMPETCRTHLENEGVYGESGMMPPAGALTRLQPGAGLDEGAGGAGSFVTVVALNARFGG